MAKTATITAKIEPELKKEVDNIFKSLGLSTSEAITMFLQKVKRQKGLPFDSKVPTEETLRVIEDTDAGKDLVECKDFDDFVRKLEV